MSLFRHLLRPISPPIPAIRLPTLKTPTNHFHSTAPSAAKHTIQNQNTKYPKHHRGRIKGTACRGDRISFGSYALRALEPGWVTARAIRAGRSAMARYARAGGKLWVRVIPDKSVTARPAETRMGRGKGNPAFMVAVVKPGRILYELGGVTEKVAKEAIALAAAKMPIRTKFVASRMDML